VPLVGSTVLVGVDVVVVVIGADGTTAPGGVAVAHEFMVMASG